MTDMFCMHQPLSTDGGIISCVSIVLKKRWDNYCRSSRPNQTRALTFSWTSKFTCKYIVYLVFLDYLDYLDYIDYLFNSDCRCKSDFKEMCKDVPLIGQGFQNIMDSYFWYIPFASVRKHGVPRTLASAGMTNWDSACSQLPRNCEHII
jgi:hypothetical protein